MPRAEMRGRARLKRARPRIADYFFLSPPALAAGAAALAAGAAAPLAPGAAPLAPGAAPLAPAAAAPSAPGAAAAPSAAAPSVRHRGDDFLFLLRGARDRRDREVAALDRRLDALGQFHRRYVHGAADFETGEIDLEESRHLVVRAGDLDVVAHDVQHAAALEAGRERLVDEAHGHRDADAAVFADAHEIDVDGQVLHGVDLQLARKHAVHFAVDLDLEHGGGEVALDHLFPQVAIIENDQLGRLAVAVDHSRNLAFTTGLACGPLACTRARRGFELAGLLSHGIDLQQKKGPVRPIGPRGLQGCRAASHSGEMARVIAADQGLGNRR